MSDETEAAAPPARPLFLVKGDATPEEVAALAVVLQGIAATAAAAEPEERTPRSEWSAPQRAVRPAVRPGFGGWRSSAMPR